MARDDETGIDVYPRLPVPKPKRESDVSMSRKLGGPNKKLWIAVGATLVSGAVLGFVLRPVLTTDSRVGELRDQLAESTKATDTAKNRADRLDKDLAAATAAQ